MKNSPGSFFLKNGYCISKVLNKKKIENLKKLIEIKISKDGYPKKNFGRLYNFHKIVLNDNIREKILNPSQRFIRFNKKFFFTKDLKKTLNDIMLRFWGHNKFIMCWVGSPKKKEIQFNASGFRIVRPEMKNSKDGGREHIDAYNKDLKSFFTMWIPLIGFNKKYTMKIAKASHLINHPKSSYEKQKSFISRVFKKKYVRKFKFMRPNLNKGSAIFHHPNVIHGGNPNFGKLTRVSIEIRFFDKKKFNIRTTFDKSITN